MAGRWLDFNRRDGKNTAFWGHGIPSIKAPCEKCPLPTLCLETTQTILPNLARGVANEVISAGWGKSSQTTLSYVPRFFFTFAAFFRNLCYVSVTAALQDNRH